MRFNDNADLDTSRFEWLGFTDPVPIPFTEDPLTVFWNAFYAFFDIYMAALPGVIFLVTMAVIMSIVNDRKGSCNDSPPRS